MRSFALIAVVVVVLSACRGGGETLNGEAAPAVRNTPGVPPAGAEPSPRCRPMPPQALPDGSEPGSPAAARSAGADQLVWGRGPNAVTQQPGADVLGIIGLRSARVGRSDAYLTLVGDPGVGQTAIAFEVGDCDYTVWLQPEISLPLAREFARTYAPEARDSDGEHA